VTPKVLVFDVNETLLDITALEPVFPKIFGACEPVSAPCRCTPTSPPGRGVQRGPDSSLGQCAVARAGHTPNDRRCEVHRVMDAGEVWARWSW
jgi:hypothetical protein